MKKPYSFDNRIKNIKRKFLILFLISFFLFFSISTFQFNQSVSMWVISNNSSTTKVSITTMTNSPTSNVPIGSNSTTSSSKPIPYLAIFSENVISVLFFPMIFISICFITIQSIKGFVIRKEIFSFLNSINAKIIDENTAIVPLNESDQIKIVRNTAGRFGLYFNDEFLVEVTSDELLWKINYYKFLESDRP